MKKLLKLTIIIIFANCYFVSFSQIFGVQAGVNFASQAWKFGGDMVTDDKKVALGIQVGGTVEFDFNDKIAFQSGLLISQKGVKFKGVYGPDDTKYTDKWKLTYLDIPFNVKYKLELAGNNFYLAAGPYFGYAITGKYIYEDGNEDGDAALDIGNSEADDDFKPLDFGLNLGAGIEISVIGVGLQYSLGLPNLEPGGDEDNYIKNRVFSLLVSYKFGQ